jgi:hypothetical protein
MSRPKCVGGIGFRDMRLFNIAMLGKQGWRLMTRPDSLCARVLKGRHFPNGDFITATKKRHTSHTLACHSSGKEL